MNWLIVLHRIAKCRFQYWFIFYKDGEEVNRFVEYSQGESIEEAIAKIVSGKEYKNSYAE